MENRSYIQVIIPLKLEWEPFYVASEEVNVGDRVRVVFSNKEYAVSEKSDSSLFTSPFHFLPASARSI